MRDEGREKEVLQNGINNKGNTKEQLQCKSKEKKQRKKRIKCTQKSERDNKPLSPKVCNIKTSELQNCLHAIENLNGTIMAPYWYNHHGTGSNKKERAAFLLSPSSGNVWTNYTSTL